ncbi:MULTISPECIES: DUF6884 domain-containing protein [unclassified Streptomyces]|uniref:DUF6884 domain-containing protein n=1 Tax=unclassified Streptomyces TaxID=2593676 RepID=UPI0033D6B57E
MAAPTVRPRVIIVSCGGRKSTTEQPVPAGELYCGSYHVALRRAADALAGQAARTARVLILSALHGFVALDELIAPYDLRLGDEGSVTGEKLRQQAADLGVLHADVTVLGPRAYVEACRSVWPELTDSLAGTRGIGEQLAKLADIYAPSRRSLTPKSSARPDDGTGTSSLIEEIERRADTRQNVDEQRTARKRARYATYSRLLIEHAGRAHGTLTFPGDVAKSAARAGAARRFAALYRVQVHGRPDDARTVDVHGTPRDVARFLSALPRVLEKTESRASESARLYGRWERHSTARPHLADMPTAQRRAHARDFRAAAFQVVVDILLDCPETVPEATDGLPPWDQVYPLAAGIAHYYWFDPAALADPDETARILATAERRHVTTPAAP